MGTILIRASVPPRKMGTYLGPGGLDSVFYLPCTVYSLGRFSSWLSASGNCESLITKNRGACAPTRARGSLYTIKLKSESACREPDLSLSGLDPVPLSKIGTRRWRLVTFSQSEQQQRSGPQEGGRSRTSRDFLLSAERTQELHPKGDSPLSLHATVPARAGALRLQTKARREGGRGRCMQPQDVLRIQNPELSG